MINRIIYGIAKIICKQLILNILSLQFRIFMIIIKMMKMYITSHQTVQYYLIEKVNFTLNLIGGEIYYFN